MIYQVYVHNRSNLYDWCTESVAKYCEKYNIDHIIQSEPILRIKPNVFRTNRSEESYGKYGGYLPIYEKENAFDYFDEYDQIAIILCALTGQEQGGSLLADIAPTYFVAAAGLVAAFFGANAYAKKNGATTTTKK